MSICTSIIKSISGPLARVDQCQEGIKYDWFKDLGR
jgi:hypothetical protein